jgi:hypothetical protein
MQCSPSTFKTGGFTAWWPPMGATSPLVPFPADLNHQKTMTQQVMCKSERSSMCAVVHRNKYK